MQAKALFWDLDGRIGRQTYWLALLGLLAFGLATGPLQTILFNLFEAAQRWLLERGSFEIAVQARKIGEGGKEATGAFRDGIIAHLLRSVGLGAFWSMLFIGLALLTIRSALAVVGKRVVDAGQPKAVAWAIFGVLILSSVLNQQALPWLGPMFHVLFLSSLVIVGLLPTAGGGTRLERTLSTPPDRPRRPTGAAAPIPRSTFGLR